MFSVDITDMIEEAQRKKAEAERVKLPPDVVKLRLMGHYADWARKAHFKPGMLIRYKPGLEQIVSLKDTVIIVLEVLSQPIIGGANAATPEQGARLDIRCGALTSNGHFGLVLLESALFEPVEEA